MVVGNTEKVSKNSEGANTKLFVDSRDDVQACTLKRLMSTQSETNKTKKTVTWKEDIQVCE